jgi:hypothetical protein
METVLQLFFWFIAIFWNALYIVWHAMIYKKGCLATLPQILIEPLHDKEAVLHVFNLGRKGGGDDSDANEFIVATHLVQIQRHPLLLTCGHACPS